MYGSRDSGPCLDFNLLNNKKYRDLPGQNYHKLQLILTRESAFYDS